MRAPPPAAILLLLVAGCGGGAGRSDAGSGGGAGGSDAGPGATRSYTTTFPLTENPISEGGNWIDGQTDGLDWHDMSTTPGLAIGHQSGSSYTDGTALLTGSWGPTQTAEAVVHASSPQDDCYQEVELRLRSALAPHSCTGYEISFKATKTSGAYLIIVRWNGAVGDFSYLLNVSGAQYGVTEGDVVKATIAGDVITASIDGVEVGTATDATYATGNPGMGMNLETGDPTCVGPTATTASLATRRRPGHSGRSKRRASCAIAFAWPPNARYVFRRCKVPSPELFLRRRRCGLGPAISGRPRSHSGGCTWRRWWASSCSGSRGTASRWRSGCTSPAW